MKLELTPNEVATLELLIIEEIQDLEKRIKTYKYPQPYLTYLENKLTELKMIKEKLK